MACRDITKSKKVQEEIRELNSKTNAELMKIDLASFKSIYEFSKQFSERYDKLDVLINNAGVFCEKREETEDGFEKTIGVNYFGLFLLTNLLIPKLKKGESPRIVNVTSKAAFHGKLDIDNINFTKGYQSFKAYSASKLGVILFSNKLAKKLKEDNITVNCAHPGSVNTNIWSGDTFLMKIMGRMMKLFSVSSEEGAQTSIYLASSNEVEGITGKLFHKDNIITYKENCKNVDLQNKLWNYTLDIIKDIQR